MSLSIDKGVTWAAGAVLACLAGCAGNGAGLDANGLPVGSSSGGSTGPLTADFTSIQDNVFTPICSPCHSGASAPEGLMLDASHSYNLLVGVPSNEVPSFDRIKPSDPDHSYLVLKIQGSAGIVGSQMPLHETPLPQTTIDVIRQWVTNGAPSATASMTAAATDAAAALKQQSRPPVAPAAFAVVQTAPADGSEWLAPVRTIVIAFNREVDASLVNFTTMVVERLEDEPVHLPAYATLAAGNPNVVLVTPVAPLVPGVYRVTVRGSGGGAVADIAAQALGSDYSFTFTVGGTP